MKYEVFRSMRYLEVSPDVWSLQQYDYDSSTVRKRIFQEALVSITLPFIKKNLAPTCKTVRDTHTHTYP